MTTIAVASQPCGHCDKPVPPGRGRIPGQTWWHSDLTACRAARDRATTRRHFDAQRAASGVPPVNRATCRRCGGPRVVRNDEVDSGLCASNPECRTEARRLWNLVQARARSAICDRYRDEYRNLMQAGMAAAIASGEAVR